MVDTRNHVMVVALEFGRTYSGYAFSTRLEFEREPLQIHCDHVWHAGAETIWQWRIPTCILFDKEKQFVTFGYDAKSRYAELVMNEEQDEYYFFDRFTMSLHNNENVTRDMVLKDKTCKKCSAVEVFTLSIKYVVDHFMEELKRNHPELRVDDIVHGILWVLTVSATWTDSAKQLMRESAEKAGISPEKLLLVNEPDAAFTCCYYIPTTRLLESKLGNMIKEPGTKSMVVDLRDMTADITVLQQTFYGQLKVLCKAIGDDCGGTSLDDRVLKIIEEIAGEKVISEFKEKDPLLYIDLVREIERLKLLVSTENKTKVNIKIPYVAIDGKCKEFGGKSLQSAVDSSSYVDEITLRSDKLQFSANLIIKLYKPTIDSIITLMKNTVSNRSTNGVSNNVSNIVMVGGLSKCPMVQNAVCKAFPDNQIIIPVNADFVLNGAVLFGHRPDYIWSELRDEEGIGK